MTTTANKSISSDIRERAAAKARQTGENTVVYETEIGITNQQLFTTITNWEDATTNNSCTFLAVIDKNGQYVD